MTDPTSGPQLIRCASPEAFIHQTALYLAEHIDRAVAVHGQCLLALSGGRTPAPIYQRLGAAVLPWRHVTVTLTDERFVPPTSPDSNARLIADSLGAGVAQAAQFVPLWSDTTDLERAATLAEERLGLIHRRFDVVVLGMGDDGHTASLFPHTPKLVAGLDPESSRSCIAVEPYSPAPTQPRLSLTLSRLLASDRIVLLLTGEAKMKTLERALAGDDAVDMPIRAVLRQTRTPVDIYWGPES